MHKADSRFELSSVAPTCNRAESEAPPSWVSFAAPLPLRFALAVSCGICLLRWLQCEGPQVYFVWRQVDQFVWVIVLFGIPFCCNISFVLNSYQRSPPEDRWKEKRRQMQKHWRCCLVVVVVVGAVIAVKPSICLCAWGAGLHSKSQRRRRRGRGRGRRRLLSTQNDVCYGKRVRKATTTRSVCPTDATKQTEKELKVRESGRKRQRDRAKEREGGCGTRQDKLCCW